MGGFLHCPHIRTITSPASGSGFGTESTGSGSIVSARPGFAPARTGSSRPSRPSQLDPSLTEHIAGGLDPEEINEMSHASAAAMLDRVHHSVDPVVVKRVITLVDTEGVDVVAELWSHSEPDTLPGILWRLYLLRTWMRTNGDEISYLWRVGEPEPTSSSAIVGVDNAPDTADIARTADSILAGAFTGDFAVALERAAAFTDVIVRGMRLRAKTLQRRLDDIPKDGEADHESASPNVQRTSADVYGDDRSQSNEHAQSMRRSISSLQSTASNLALTSHDFHLGANLWRRGRLE
ncbi:hypothetical protein [Bifidobacterium bombi]|uniref:hypothetical protein n=1 Tax=Bifidobacterium bombi TaxID=471511 RepID=UPI000A8BC9DD|nr:hypothetical protein [Bifidobacterium bombi]